MQLNKETKPNQSFVNVERELRVCVWMYFSMREYVRASMSVCVKECVCVCVRVCVHVCAWLRVFIYERWTSPGDNTPRDANCTATWLPSRKLYRLDEPDRHGEVSDVLLWTPTYDQAKAGRPARTYIQQLCEDTGCNPEDLPEAMNDREKWREMVRDIRAGGTTWWWLYVWVSVDACRCNYVCVCACKYICVYMLVCVWTPMYDRVCAAVLHVCSDVFFLCVYIYIYIVLHRQTVLFYQNSSVWLEWLVSRS